MVDAYLRARFGEGPFPKRKLSNKEKQARIEKLEEELAWLKNGDVSDDEQSVLVESGAPEQPQAEDT